MAPKWVSVWFTDAVSWTSGVPEIRSGAVSAGERKTRQLAVTVVGLLRIVVSLCDALSVNVVACSPPLAGASASAPASAPGPRNSWVGVDPGIGQLAAVSQVPGPVSMLTCGSSMIPLGTFHSQ